MLSGERQGILGTLFGSTRGAVPCGTLLDEACWGWDCFLSFCPYLSQRTHTDELPPAGRSFNYWVWNLSPKPDSSKMPESLRSNSDCRWRSPKPVSRADLAGWRPPFLSQRAALAAATLHLPISSPRSSQPSGPWYKTEGQVQIDPLHSCCRTGSLNKFWNGSDKGLASRIYKELLKLSTRKMQFQTFCF